MPIDWHMDLQSGKRFPQKFSHGINIRSDEFGSAKHVWEVNRMQFLLHICMLYQKSGDMKYVELFFYHLASWKNANPYMVGVNWYSNIEVNLRLICWYFCWQALGINDLRCENAAVDGYVRDIWLPLIHEHADYSYNHPSLYSSANNHLVSEYAGLFVAATRWEIPHRTACLKYAKAGLEREILAQNTPEGVNREEAAEYIQFIDDFFLLAAIAGKRAGEEFSESYKNRLHTMAGYLNAFLDCRFNYPMYGDGDDGFVLRPDAGGHFNNFRSLLVSFAVFFEESSFKRAGLAWDDKNELLFGAAGREKFEAMPTVDTSALDGNSFFAESGHFIFRKIERVPVNVEGDTVREIYMHLDAAPLGYLSIAAHGHADALSFILHVDGYPVLVDPGTFTYHTHKSLRRYFVSTIAHNTVCVNGKNQAEQAGPTMWLKHYKVKSLFSDEQRGRVRVSHDGYARDGVTHMRRVEFERNENCFTITDTLEGFRKYMIELPFHVHPNAIVKLKDSEAVLSLPGCRQVSMQLDEKLAYTVRGDGFYSEHFGEKQPAEYLYAKKVCTGRVEFVTRIRVL